MLQSKAYADAEDAEFQLGADLEERGGMASALVLLTPYEKSPRNESENSQPIGMEMVQSEGVGTHTNMYHMYN